jgi:fumarate reductase flavoprotein subunit
VTFFFLKHPPKGTYDAGKSWSAEAVPACAPRSLPSRPIPHLSVAMVSKVYPMRSHTVSAEGGAAGVIRSDDSLDEHAYDTMKGGDWLCDQDAVEAFVKEAPPSCCAWSTGAAPGAATPTARSRAPVRRHEEAAHVVRRRQDRLPHAAHAVPDSLKYDRITCATTSNFVTRLLVDDGRVPGRGRDRAPTGSDARRSRPRR